MAKIRGINENQEVSSQRIYRDTRTQGARTAEWLRSTQGACTIIFIAAFLGAAIPTITEVMALLGICQFWYFKSNKVRLPLKLPKHLKMKDYNDTDLVTGKPGPSDGTFFLGNDMVTKEELWLGKKDYCTHVLMLATTGGGKTEALVSQAMNSLAQGSGFTYVDGKADVSLLVKIYSLCRMMGREDDLLVVNYNTGGVDISFDTPDQKISNTLNPFSFGSSSSLTQLLVSLMSDSGGKGDFWKDRAISLVEAIIPALVWLRDKRGLLLDVSVIREYLNLSRILELRKIPQMPMNIQESLRAYCENLAGWQERKGAAQGDTTMEQHGYLQMQFTRTLGSLGDVYGHIFRTPLGEVDMYDVITNRRILLVLLPALEKSPPELANLGRIIVALLKNMMAAALGRKMEGDIYEVLDDRFTNAEAPYQTLFDEYGYYSVDGSAVMPAQARSLNIGMTFAGQDYPAFKKSSEENAKSIIANCNVKIFGKIEDSEDTFNLYKQQVGEVYVTNTGGYKKATGFFGNFTSSDDASIQTVSRANLLDLKEKREGQMDILFKSKLIRAALFYANPPRPKTVRINEFVRVRPPSPEALERINDSVSELIAKLKSEDFLRAMPKPVGSLDVERLLADINQHAKLHPTARSAAVVASYHQKNIENASLVGEPGVGQAGGPQGDSEDLFEEEVFSASPRAATIFSKAESFQPPEVDHDLLALTERMIAQERNGSPGDRMIAATIGSDYTDESKRAMAVMSGLLSEEAVQEGIEQIETQMGATPAQAATTAEKTVQEMESLTQYPKTAPPEKMEPEELVEAIDILDEFMSESEESTES